MKPSLPSSYDDFHAQATAVIIPAYRAEKTIALVINSLPDWIQWIIIVNDAGPDHTLEIAQNCQKQNQRITIIEHDINQGVGGAMLSGYQAAVKLGAQIFVKMDSDGQMDPQYLPALLRPILAGKADYTKGNRFLHETELKSMPMIRRIGNLGISFLSKLASGYWNIFDPTNGYTALTRDTFLQINPANIAPRHFFETSMLIELSKRRAVVQDVLIPARYANEISSLSILKTLVEFPPKLLAGFLSRVGYLYILRDFNAISVLGISGILSVLFGSIWGLIKWIRSDQTGIPASTGTIMIAVLPIILGIQFLLQALMLDIQNVPMEPISHTDQRDRNF